MADVFETRCISETFLGSANVLRVACIGDSMMYGQGVPSRETLPAHLSRLMNAALIDHLVWTDNFGESSGNIWHAWTQFKHRAHSMQIDAVVFSICDNDIAMFESNTVIYKNSDYPDLWNFGGIAEAADELLIDIKYYCQIKKIYPIIIFYRLTKDGQVIVDRLRKLCHEIGLLFIDTLSYISAGTIITAGTHIATEFDGHPAGLVHELVARALVEIFLKLPGLPGGRFNAGKFDALAAALNDLLAQGVAADAVLGWAEEALTAKQRAVRRDLRQDRRPLATEFRALAGKVAALCEKWRVLRRLDARLEVADCPKSVVMPNLSQLYVKLRNLDELIFVLLKTADREGLAGIGRLFLDGWYAEPGRLDFFKGDVPGEIAAARAALLELPVVRRLQQLAEETEEGMWRSLSAHAGLTLASFRAEFARLGQFASHLWSQLDIMSAAWPARAEDDPDILRLWAIAIDQIRAALYYFRECETIFAQGPTLGAAVPNRWTAIDVIVESGPDPAVSGAHYQMRVEAQYRVPRRQSIRELHWGGVNKDRYAHHFEIPVLLLGNIQVGVADDEPTLERFRRGTTRIAEIRISSDTAAAGAAPSAPSIEWHNDGQNLSHVDFKDIMLP